MKHRARIGPVYAFCLCCLTAVATAAGPPLPNIVFILCDDLGINDLYRYGRQDHRTPHLDRLATQGTRFTSAYCAQPICSPSRAAILTGKAPARLHLTTFLPGRRGASRSCLAGNRARDRPARLPCRVAQGQQGLRADGLPGAHAQLPGTGHGERRWQGDGDVGSWP